MNMSLVIYIFLFFFENKHGASEAHYRGTRGQCMLHDFSEVERRRRCRTIPLCNVADSLK